MGEISQLESTKIKKNWKTQLISPNAGGGIVKIGNDLFNYMRLPQDWYKYVQL